MRGEGRVEAGGTGGPPGRWRPVLRARGLTYRHPRAKSPAVREVSVSVAPRRLLAVAGPNGAGKTTLLRLLGGSLRPQEGSVRLDERPLAEFDDRERARALAVVPQSERSTFPVTVRDLVGMGRYAHLDSWRRAASRDRAAVERALERCAIVPFADRRLESLSGGELQRARIARALAQETPVLLLDEPTGGLDLRYRMELFHLLGELRDDGLAVLVVTHDLNLAARFADRLLLLDRGRSVARGTPVDVLSREMLEEVYEWPLRVEGHPGPGCDKGAPQTIPLRREAARGAGPRVDRAPSEEKRAQAGVGADRGLRGRGLRPVRGPGV